MCDHSSPDIRLVDGLDDALAARLDEELAAFNFDATGIRDARDFAAALHDEGRALMAGVWMREDARHRGLGRLLLMAVESEARARGCGQLALTTHSFQAPEIYRRPGCETVGELADHPVGHASLLLRKRLR